MADTIGRTETLYLKVDTIVKAALQAEADDLRVPLSEIARRALGEYVARRNRTLIDTRGRYEVEVEP